MNANYTIERYPSEIGKYVMLSNKTEVNSLDR